MDARSMVADLFGHGDRQTLTLKRAVEARRAVLNGASMIQCDGIYISGPNPIALLCGALLASGRPDSAMRVVTPAGEAVCFIASVHETALAGRAAP